MKSFTNIGTKNRLTKYFFIIIPILLVLGFLGYLQVKTFNANRLLKYIKTLDSNDIYQLNVYSKKEQYWNPEYKQFDGDEAYEMLVLFKEQDFKYYNFMDQEDLYKHGGYNLDDFMVFEIITADKKYLSLTLSVNSDFNRAIVIVEGYSIYNNSAVYKFPYDSGTQLYSSLIHMIWTE